MTDTYTVEVDTILVDADGNATGWALVGGWRIDRDFETIRTERTPVVPDERWSVTHGDHNHRWTSTDTPYVMLNAERYSKHIECDGSCGGVCQGEGYHVPAYRCAVTGEDVEPGYKPDPRGNERQMLRSETLTFRLTGGGTPMPEIPEGYMLQWQQEGGEYPGTHQLVLARMHAGETTFENDQPPVVEYHGPIHYPEDAP